MAPVHNVTSVDDFNKLLNDALSTTLIALNFHAPWAVPCKQMNQVFETLAARSDEASSLFIAIDAEELPDVSESYDVSAVPYFLLLKAGEVLNRFSGADPAKLSAEIEKHAPSTPGLTLPPAQSTTAPSLPAGEEAPQEEEDLNTRLGKLVSAAPVMLFMKGTPASPQCGFSRQLVGLLRERGVRYGFFNILADDEVRQGLKTFSDWPTFPQLYMGGQLIGGLDIVKEEMENDPEFLKSPEDKE
ncbi:monothiol glutaredoxin [Geopyxis carbonaria]|nr:monothiol glutaredoxin [Geopyxis carbonaria]